MDNRFFEKPILNSPYDYPARHWELGNQGQPTQRIIERRRSVEFITPIPRPKKRKDAHAQLRIFDEGDFSLMDAIECGIVKLPRGPVADKIPGGQMPKFRNLWKHIRTRMPKKGRGKARNLNPLNLPIELQTALETLYGHYEKTFRLWQDNGIHTRRASSSSATTPPLRNWCTTTFPAFTRKTRMATPAKSAATAPKASPAGSSIPTAMRKAFLSAHAANDPYKALKTTLKAEIDAEAWTTLNNDTSRPFDKPKSGRIAVKVINHLGDEVM